MSLVKNTALLAALTVSMTALQACAGSKPVLCAGVSTDGNPIAMSSGECNKLANSKQEPLPAGQTAPQYPYDTYVKCYGVAAANMNDCGTSTTACGGSVSQAGSPDAWIAIPRAICAQLKNGVIVEPKANS